MVNSIKVFCFVVQCNPSEGENYYTGPQLLNYITACYNCLMGGREMQQAVHLMLKENTMKWELS